MQNKGLLDSSQIKGENGETIVSSIYRKTKPSFQYTYMCFSFKEYNSPVEILPLCLVYSEQGRYVCLFFKYVNNAPISC